MSHIQQKSFTIHEAKLIDMQGEHFAQWSTITTVYFNLSSCAELSGIEIFFAKPPELHIYEKKRFFYASKFEGGFLGIWKCVLFAGKI